MQSIWQCSQTPNVFDNIKNDRQADTVVIGAGLAGLLTAYFLTSEGQKVIVLEKGKVGRGLSSKMTGKISYLHGGKFSSLIKNFGVEKATEYARANEKAMEEYVKLIKDNNIDCDLVKCDAVLCSEDKDTLMKEHYALDQIGVKCKVNFSSNNPLGKQYELVVKDNYVFNPVKFMDTISKGMEIYQDSCVTEITGNQAVTEGGCVRGNNIVVATNFPFFTFPGMYYAKLRREMSYFVDIKSKKDVAASYLSLDEDGLTLRKYNDTLILGGYPHITGIKEDNRFELLNSKASELFGEYDVKNSWVTQDTISEDSMPYIGKVSKSKVGSKRTYVISGFGKWGATNSMVASKLITDMIMGRESSYEKVVTPSRFKFIPHTKSVCINGARAAKYVVKGKIGSEIKDVNEVKQGEGKIVKIGGKKYGVYRDDKDELYYVNGICPHMKGELQFNSEDKTWDCPCHSSRFDIDGNLIDGPSTSVSIKKSPNIQL